MWQFTVNMQHCTYLIETLYYFNICWKCFDRSFSNIFIALEIKHFFTVTIVTGGIKWVKGSMAVFDFNSTSKKHIKDMQQEPWTYVIVHATPKIENLLYILNTFSF